MANQFLQVLAFKIVSAVVNVLEFMTNNVYSGSNPSTALSKSIGSTFAKNLNLLFFAPSFPNFEDRKASYTNSRDKYEPPIPITTTLVRAFPVCP